MNRRGTVALVLALAVVAPPLASGLPTTAQSDAGGAGDASDDAGDARTLQGAGTFKGAVSPPTDVWDWFEFHLEEEEELWVGLQSSDGATFQLYDPDGDLHHGSGMVTAASWGRSYQTLLDDPEPGIWQVRVAGEAFTRTPYRLSIGFGEGLSSSPEPVVVATFDTGTNPFHPCFREPALADPADRIPTYPDSSVPLDLAFRETYQESVEASQEALGSITDDTLYHVPDTRISYWSATASADSSPLVDTAGHGAQASSQIACEEFGFGTNVQLVILDRRQTGGSNVGNWTQQVAWAADQPWIDILHMNIAVPFPYPWRSSETHAAAESGRLVVSAAGNGVGNFAPGYPAETGRYSGVAGTLLAGMVGNAGWNIHGNMDPHVVMDGEATDAADWNSMGETTFDGTSSASPRTAGYAARLLGILRAQWGHDGAGLLTIPEGEPAPESGILADRELTDEELHRVIRKTAVPWTHPSRFDDGSGWLQPAAPDLAEDASYAKIGYGEISEFSLLHGVSVASGEAPMPDRPVADRHYETSETMRVCLLGCSN